MSILENFEKLLADGTDNAMLRYSLGSEHLKLENNERATEHLRRAVEHDPNYSAAWKLLGRALAAAGEDNAAIKAYTAGIAAADKKGDRQAAKEMQVFLRRLVNSGLHQDKD